MFCNFSFHVSARIKFGNKCSPDNLVLYTEYTQYKQIIRATQYYSKLLGTLNVVIQLRVWPTLVFIHFGRCDDSLGLLSPVQSLFNNLTKKETS